MSEINYLYAEERATGRRMTDGEMIVYLRDLANDMQTKAYHATANNLRAVAKELKLRMQERETLH